MNMRGICLVMAAGGCLSAGAVDFYKADNTTALNQVGSWEDGNGSAVAVVPGISDTVIWDGRVSAGVAVAGATWGTKANISFNKLCILDPGADVVIGRNGDYQLRIEGANPSVDLQAATHDLWVDAPMMLGSGANVIVQEGRTVTFATALSQGGPINKRGLGMLAVHNANVNAGVTFYGGTTRYTGTTGANMANSLRLEQGYNSTVILDGTLGLNNSTADQMAVFNGTLVFAGGAFTSGNYANARLYAGRYYGNLSDGMVIVSNGAHRIQGGNGGDSEISNVIGFWGGKRGRLFMEGGSLTLPYLRLSTDHRNAISGPGGQTVDMPDLITVNDGLLSVLGANQPFKMGVRSNNGSSGCQRWGILTVNGGRFEVPNGEFHFADNLNGGADCTQDIVLNGGTLAISNMVVGSHSRMVRTVTFDGGTLEGTNVTDGAELVTNPANAAWKVRAGGAFICAAENSDFVFSANLVEDSMSTGGGLVKMGPGLVVLSGANAYTGPTVVSNGWLGISGSVDGSCGLLVADGAGLMLADQDETAQELSFDWAVFGDGAGLCVDACDVIHAGTLEIGGAGLVDIRLEEGALGSFSQRLMTFDTIIGAENLAGWTVVNGDGNGYVASVRAENGALVVTRVSTRGTVILVQ